MPKIMQSSLTRLSIFALGAFMVILFAAAVPSSPDRHDTYAAMGGATITKADADITYPDRAIWPRGLMVGDTGQVTLTTMDGSVLVFTDAEITKAIMLPICVRRISSTGTNATKFKVFW